MEYFTREGRGLRIVDSASRRIFRGSPKALLETLLQDELTTFEGRLEALKRRFGWRRNVPVYIDEERCFFLSASSREVDTLWVNAPRVVAIHSIPTGARIDFFSGTSVELSRDSRLLRRRWQRALVLMRLIRGTV